MFPGLLWASLWAAAAAGEATFCLRLGLRKLLRAPVRLALAAAAVFADIMIV
jgi:hypothetical protein